MKDRKKKIKVPPRQEVIRLRYAAFLQRQAQILKSSHAACQKKILQLQKSA